MTRDHQRPPLLLDQVGDLQILLLEGLLRVEQQHDDLGKADRLQRVAHRKLFGAPLHPHLAPQSRRVEQQQLPSLPFERGGDRVARDTRLGPGDHSILAEQRVDESRLADIRPPDDGDAQWMRRLGLDHFASRNLRRSLARAARLLDDLGDIADADAVLGGDRQRLAEPERVGFVDARLGRAALAFVRREDHLFAGAAHQFGEDLIRGHDAGPRVDQEQHEIGLGDGSFRLLAHARREPLIPGLQPRGIDEGDGAGAELRLGLAPVARQARLVVDQREPLADQPVEQGGLADIRPSDDGDGEGHWPLGARKVPNSLNSPLPSSEGVS